MRRIILYGMLSMCLSLAAYAAEWPGFLGPTANGFSAETGINQTWGEKPPALLWQIPLSDDGFAGPAVFDGKVFIIDHQGKQDIVRALDINTGTEIWKYAYDDTGTKNFGDMGFTNTTPLIDRNNVYTLSHLGLVNCFESKTGKVIWTRNIITDFKGKMHGWCLSASPLIDGEKLILCPGGNDAAVVALNKTTGTTIWQGGGSDYPGDATPVPVTINGKRQYVVFTATTVMGVDVSNGTVLWTFPWNVPVNASTPIVKENAVFITSAYGRGAALLDITDAGAKMRWKAPDIRSCFTTPIYSDGYLYTTTESSMLTCLEFKTGTVKWRHSGFEQGGLVAVAGMLIIVDGKTGEVAMVKMTPDSYQELGRIKPLGGQSWTAPIVAEGKLIVRNRKALACLSLTTVAPTK